MPGRKPTGRPTGRPRAEIDWDEFEKLCQMQCTLVELAAWFKCSIDTISAAVKREKGMLFSEYTAQRSNAGKAALRRMQWRSAEGGSNTMQIWLGKQLLEQREPDQSMHHSLEVSNEMKSALETAHAKLVAGLPRKPDGE